MIKFGLKKKIRPVNRLDRNTSGLVIFAKCEYIQECLSKQMLNKSFKKEYIAIVSGKFANAEKSGTVNFLMILLLLIYLLLEKMIVLLKDVLIKMDKKQLLTMK